jgi:hypothetical protein
VRQWLGSSLLALLGILSGLVAPLLGQNWFLWVSVAAGFFFGAYLARPSFQDAPAVPATTALIRGNANGSCLNNVEARSDFLIDGDANDSKIHNVRFNAESID